MKLCYHSLIKHVVIAILICAGSINTASAKPNRAQAIATVRAILNKNASACRIYYIQNVSAARVGPVWKVTVRFKWSDDVSSGIGTAHWNVRVSDGKAVAANQWTAEIENGCPAARVMP